MRAIAIIVLIVCLGCIKQNHHNTLRSFFLNTKWDDFNSQNLSANHLEHFIANKIDFFNRESFFAFMSKEKLNIQFEDFYLIELENKNGEKPISKKIIVVNYNNKHTYLGFMKFNDWETIELSKNEIDKFRNQTVKEGMNKIGDWYGLTTNVKANCIKK